MKYLILLLVIAVVAWLVLGRRRPPPPPPRGEAARPAAPSEPQAMLACAHCAVHLPRSDAQFDAAGRPVCSQAHLLAGPR